MSDLTKYERLAVRRVMDQIGRGMSYVSAISKVGRDMKYPPEEIINLTRNVARQAWKRRQITRVQARELRETITWS